MLSIPAGLPPLGAPERAASPAASRLGAEADHLPGRPGSGAGPAEAVVQAVRAVGPELDLERGRCR